MSEHFEINKCKVLKSYSHFFNFWCDLQKTHVSYREKLFVAQVADNISLDFRDVFLKLHFLCLRMKNIELVIRNSSGYKSYIEGIERRKGRNASLFLIHKHLDDIFICIHISLVNY
jgi:hypothetical protein